MARWRLVTAVVVLLAATAVVVGWQWLARELAQPLALPSAGCDLVVAPGDNAKRVMQRLEQRGVLKHPALTVLYMRLTSNTNIKSGEYRLPQGITTRALVRKLVAGDVRRYTVTVIEGWTYAQALGALSRAPALVHSPDLAERVGKLAASVGHDVPEGLFFPDTYQYVRGTTDFDILRRAFEKMQDVLDKQWAQRADDLPYKTPYQALIMASLIEKETAVASERRQIAGVFVNRLRRGMRLQTDPTVIYALGDAYSGNLTRADLELESPFNTYRVRGLPPTPIALPGRRSIRAALHPAEGGMLYFVARGDGTHHFSRTLADHNRAVRHYQVNDRARDYRSVPASQRATSKGAAQ